MSEVYKSPWLIGVADDGYFVSDGLVKADIAQRIPIKKDALLMAAAPELLEALEMFMNAGIGNSTGFGAQYDAFEKAKAAIAKANGDFNAKG